MLVMSDVVRSFAEAEQLLASGRLQHELDVRLVQIAFGSNVSAAIRAIEMLQASGAGGQSDDLSRFPTDLLLEARALLVKRLIQLEQEASDGGGSK